MAEPRSTDSIGTIHSRLLDDLVDSVDAASPGWRQLPLGWTSGHGLAACHTCGKPTTIRDPLGFARHSPGGCPGERRARSIDPG